MQEDDVARRLARYGVYDGGGVVVAIVDENDFYVHIELCSADAANQLANIRGFVPCRTDDRECGRGLGRRARFGLLSAALFDGRFMDVFVSAP